MCSLCWHLPIFPGRRQPSIVGASELNFCVRNGNRWTLTAIDTNFRRSKLGFTSFPPQAYASVENYVRLVAPPLTIESTSLGFDCVWFCKVHVCTFRTEQRILSKLSLHSSSRSSPRVISTSQLNALLRLHLWPINGIVYTDPYSFTRMGELILGKVSRLDAFSVYLVRT